MCVGLFIVNMNYVHSYKLQCIVFLSSLHQNRSFSVICSFQVENCGHSCWGWVQLWWLWTTPEVRKAYWMGVGTFFTTSISRKWKNCGNSLQLWMCFHFELMIFRGMNWIHWESRRVLEWKKWWITSETGWFSIRMDPKKNVSQKWS